jgi:hypothetical protein
MTQVLSDYEKAREENIRRNKAKMDFLLKPHVEVCKQLAIASRPPPPKPRAQAVRRIKAPVPLRRSERDRGAPPENAGLDSDDGDMQYWEDDEDDDPQGMGSGELRKMPRVRREVVNFVEQWNGSLPPWTNSLGEVSHERCVRRLAS